jgi:hypothetical protein
MDPNALIAPVTNFLAQPPLAFALQAAVGYLALLWIFAILWVIKDASNRSESIAFQLISVLIVVIATPFVGLPLYLLIRPSQSLFEKDVYEMLQYLVGDDTEDAESGEEVKEEEEEE